jgi:hypothetical protein
VAKIRLNPTTEFFATRDELAEWAYRWIQEYHLYSLLVRRRDFAVAKDTDWKDFQEFKVLLPQFDVLLFGVEPFNLTGKTSNEVLSSNSHGLAVDLPKSKPQGLRAADIGSLAQDRRTVRIWKAIVKDVLDKTTAGLWSVNRSIPAKRLHASLRYSPGAAAVHRNGVQLLTFAAEMPVLVDEPEL